jgi:phosphate acyltransferase
MTRPVRIALDAMGGDHGPAVVIPGAALAQARHPDTEFIFFGTAPEIEAALAAHARLRAVRA